MLHFRNLMPAAGVALATALAGWAHAADTTFTYQGRLDQSNSPANGSYDFVFSLWTQAGGGAMLDDLAMNNVPVADGLFAVELDFGPDAFNEEPHGDVRWLEIEVENNTLSPRQKVTGAPRALNVRGIYLDDDEQFGFGLKLPTARVHVRQNDANAIKAESALEDAAVGIAGADGKAGVRGINFADDGYGVFGDVQSGRGVFGRATEGYGVYGQATSGISTGVFGDGAHTGVRGQGGTTGVYGLGGRYSIFGADAGPDGWAGYFAGRGHFTGRTTIGESNVQITGAENFGIHSPIGSGFAGMYISTAGGGGQPFYGYAAGRNVDAYHYFDGNVDQWKLWCGGDRLVVNRQNGRVGINTTSPAYQLEVNGTAGKPGGGSWSNSSDARLKKDVEELDGALERLMQLRGVEFEYIDPAAINELDGRRVGMLAQEVEAVFPDWVEESGHGFKMVTFRGFEALTVEALRELRAEKNGEMETLRAENATLRERLDALESLLKGGAE